ncbi:MAG: sigma factor [Phycisphaerae bacterium]
MSDEADISVSGSDSAISPEQRVRAFVESSGFESLVKCYAKRYANLRYEIAEEDFSQQLATRLIEAADIFQSAKSPTVSAWAASVAANLLVDVYRQRQRSPGITRNERVLAAVSKDDSANKSQVDAMLTLWSLREKIQFSETDLQLLEKRLAPMSRCVALAARGYNYFVPARRWQAWLDAAELKADFPGDNFWAAANKIERNMLLAEQTGVAINTLTQQQLRGARWLQQTSVARRLAGEAAR